MVRLLSPEEELEHSSEEANESNEDDSVRIGEWSIRQPSYGVRVPGHLFTEREPQADDCLEIMFIAQQASEVELLD